LDQRQLLEPTGRWGGELRSRDVSPPSGGCGQGGWRLGGTPADQHKDEPTRRGGGGGSVDRSSRNGGKRGRVDEACRVGRR
jgi:hypothetical protein